MTFEYTIAEDADIPEFSERFITEVLEEIRAATDEPGRRLAPCRVTVDLDAEAVAEPPEGDRSGTEGVFTGP